MIDRQKLETILCRRFPDAAAVQVAAAANAIMGLGDEWEEVMVDTHRLAQHGEPGTEFKVLRRRADARTMPRR